MTDKKRCYKQFCSVARALDILGERWTLLIVRDLLLGPWRYADLMARLPGITTNLLARRLKEMEANGLIKKQAQTSVGSPHVYELTALGRQLEPVILSLGKFGMNLMADGPQEGEQIDIGRALLSLKLRFRDKNTGLVTLKFNSLTGDERSIFYQIKYSAGYVDIHHGKPWQSGVEITLSIATMTAILFRNASAAELEESGEIIVTGKKKQWEAFLKDFSFS